MKFHVLTLFPDMVLNGLQTSIIGRAVENNFIEINAVNIRDFSTDKHGKVDDYTYGGGAGMLMQAQPVYDAWKSLAELDGPKSETEAGQQGRWESGKRPRTIYVTPQGHPFTQQYAMELAKEEELVFLCGHYEGVDARVLDEIVTDYISIGDYVLTGGELPAMVMIDAVSRLVPGVLHNEESAQTESFYCDLLEYPQYSRPEVWHDKAVPKVLLSGNHKEIEKWRLEQSISLTKERRADLYQKYERKQKLVKKLSKNKRNNIHMMESLSRGKGEILFWEKENMLIYDGDSGVCMIKAESREAGQMLLDMVPGETKMFISSQEFLNSLICEKYSYVVLSECYQLCYTKKESLPVKHKNIRELTIEHLDYVAEHYPIRHKNATEIQQYVRERIQANAMYGAFVDERLVGFGGIHREGSIGPVYIEEAFRCRGIGESLESFIINVQLRRGFIPYGHVPVQREFIVKKQEELGLYTAKDSIWWLGMQER